MCYEKASGNGAHQGKMSEPVVVDGYVSDNKRGLATIGCADVGKRG